VADQLEPLHSRSYQVDAYRRSQAEFVLRGSVIDRKPPGMYVEVDPEPFEMHHMVVELTIAYPELTIVDAEVAFNTFPHETCPVIAQRYRDLIGLSIGRGFTHQVRERFGGPRGCSHTTALLQAMAPVAVQCHWSMAILARRDAGTRAALSPEDRADSLRLSENSCHVWAPGGELYEGVKNGNRHPRPMVSLQRRLEELGIDPVEWQADQFRQA
jgi:hypothetical protein